MSLKYQIMETAPFPEFTAVPLAQATNSDFDIIASDETSLHSYCQSLINKVFQLTHSKLNAFIQHHLQLTNEPIKWLNKFEKLLSLNEALFDTERNKSRLVKLYTLIQSNRVLLESSSIKEVKIKTPQRLINAATEERHFSFHEVKSYVETKEDFNEKVLYLNEEIFEYKQADIISINNKLQPYDVQCQNLLEKLQSMRKLKAEFDKEQKESAQQNVLQIPIKPKLRINGSTNILVNVFKQMMKKKGSNNQPYLNYNIKEVAEFICDSFVDEFGQPLSKATVQTYLSPNRTDKDPNNDEKIRL